MLSAPSMASWAMAATRCNNVSRSSSSVMLRPALTSILPSVAGEILFSAAASVTTSATTSASLP